MYWAILSRKKHCLVYPTTHFSSSRSTNKPWLALQYLDTILTFCSVHTRGRRTPPATLPHPAAPSCQSCHQWARPHPACCQHHPHRSVGRQWRVTHQCRQKCLILFILNNQSASEMSSPGSLLELTCLYPEPPDFPLSRSFTRLFRDFIAPSTMAWLVRPPAEQRDAELS